MTFKFGSAFRKKCKRLLFLGVGFSIIICNSASAVLINFDELDQNHYIDANGELTYLSNEYEAQGLLLNYAYLVKWFEGVTPVSLTNYIAGPGFGLEFVGDLPTTVSFYLGSHSKTAVVIDALGPNYSKSIVSSGEIHGMTDDQGTPYIPNQVFSLTSSTGISAISFSGQGDAYIDDLSYTYASVPEPSIIALFGIGLAGLIIRRSSARRFLSN